MDTAQVFGLTSSALASLLYKADVWLIQAAAIVSSLALTNELRDDDANLAESRRISRSLWSAILARATVNFEVTAYETIKLCSYDLAVNSTINGLKKFMNVKIRFIT